MTTAQRDPQGTSTGSSWIRALILTLSLYGSQLPRGAMIQVAAIGAAAALVALELLKGRFTLVPWAAGLTLVLTSPVWFMGISPVGEYGQSKFEQVATTTPLALLSAVLVRNRTDLLTLARAWVVLGTILALTTLLSPATGDAGRAIGFASNPIGLARPIATGVISALWLLLAPAASGYRTQRRAPLVAATALMLVGIVLTGSKGPLVGVAIGAGTLVLVNSDRAVLSRALKIGFAGVVAIMILAVSPLASTRVGQFVLSPLSAEDQVRSEFVTDSLDAITAGLTSQGIGSWSQTTGHRGIFWPHNIWLELLIEFGWVVAVIVTASMAIVLVRAFRWSKRNPLAPLLLAWLLAEMWMASISGDIRARTLFFTLGLCLLVQRNWAKELRGEKDRKRGPRSQPTRRRSQTTSPRVY